MDIQSKASSAANNITNLAKTTASSVAAGSRLAAAKLTVRIRILRGGAKLRIVAVREYSVEVYGDLSVKAAGTAKRFSRRLHRYMQRFSAWQRGTTPPRLGDSYANDNVVRENIAGDTLSFKSSALVCARSFFNGSFTRANKLRRTWSVASATLCAAIALSVAIVNSTFSLDLYYRGQEVGMAGDIVQVEQIVSGAEQQLSEILGHEFPLTESLSISASPRKAMPDTTAVENAILASVDGVEEKYVLMVGGAVVGASDEHEVLSGLLDGVLDEYSSEATSSVRFVDEVTVVKKFVSEDVVSDPDVIKTLIAPENPESEYSLAVENVESTLISEEIPFEVEYIEDDTLYDGDSVLVEKGESGVVLVTEQLVKLNGVEQSRVKVAEMVAKTPVTEVVAVGTAERPATASYGSYIWPADGYISSYYGRRSTSVGSSDHKGLDIAGRLGQSIYAADGGEVVYSGWKKAYGYMVQIRHDNGEETVYGHNSELLVNVGERVARGQEIAKMGSTGLSTGVHCHFEVRVDGNPVDPQRFLT